MAATYSIDGSAVSQIDAAVDLVEVAEKGEVGSGTFTVDNTGTGSLAVVGHKDVAVTENDCTDALIVAGFVGPRRYYRGTPKTGSGRRIDVTVLDNNALLSFKVIRSNGGSTHASRTSRPRETVDARIAWLLADELADVNVVDNGFVASSSNMMDKNDYRTMKAGDVLSDCALAAGRGWDWFVYPDPATGDPSLWFDNPNTSTNYSSTLRLSNILADVDRTTTFEIEEPTELDRDPSEVFSSSLLVYRNGRVYRTRTATALAFAARDGVAPSSTVKRRATAIGLADDFNDQHATETDYIDTYVRLPSSKVNLIRAGMRVPAKFEDYTTEGYGSAFNWFRVKRRTTHLIVSPQAQYLLDLRLSPQETFGPQLLQCKSTFSAAETTVFMDSPVTIGSLLVSRLITRDTETIPLMFDGTWTLLASGAATGSGGSTHGAVAMYGKIATSTSQSIGREATANQMEMTVCEIAGAGLSDITAFSATHQTGGTVNLGSGGGTLGLWIIAIPRGTDQLGNGFTITPSAGWTVEKNQDIDNEAACHNTPADPWWWAAKIENQTNVDVSATIAGGLCGGQFVAQWCAAAIFV